MLLVQSSRRPQDFASISSVVAERRRERGVYRGDRWAMSRRTSAWRSGRTGARIRLKIVKLLGTNSPHRPTKSEINRPCRFDMTSKKNGAHRDSRSFSIDFAYILLTVYRTPIGNGTLDFNDIWHECRHRYATHSYQISSKSNMPFVRERTKRG